VFLRVFSIRRQGLSLLSEVDCATSIDNQRSRGAAIAGFRAELFESRIELCRDSTNSRVIRTFRKIGNSSSHQCLFSMGLDIADICLDMIAGVDYTQNCDGTSRIP
jgi:hypothetical protein